MIDEQAIRCWWTVFKKDNPLTEVRILGQSKTFSGYYTDVERLIKDVRNFDGLGIYATINAVKPACYGRLQRDQMVQKPKETTSDNDIDFRTTILIDLDPKRASGTNSSDEEKRRTLDKAREIYSFLDKQGFEKPVVADSANGYHLYYRVYLTNSPEVGELVKNFLKALDMLFSDNRDGGVVVDTSVYNPARIAKLIGTTSSKGADSPDRPRRTSCFLSVPDEFKETDIAYIRKVAEMLPKPEEPSHANSYSPQRIDVGEFLKKHNIEVVRETRFDGGIKYVLKECPFDHNHKDAAVFALNNGAAAFHCFHQSCQQYHWRDFRLVFEPDAYDYREREEFAQKRRYNTPIRQEDIQPVQEDSRGKKWMCADEFKPFDIDDYVAIPYGIPELDRKLIGQIIGELTIISGSSGAGKSTFLNHLILTAAQRNYITALWSGEMKGGKIVSWLDQAAAGKNNVRLKAGTDNFYQVPPDIRKKINAWLHDRLFIYNNAYGQKWSQLSADIREVLKKKQINLVLIDNLMAVDIDTVSGDNNDKQKNFIVELSDIAKEYNVHIVLVAHPRKENLTQLIRKESIAGTADITNRADNVILLHRVGRDFERRAKEFFGPAAVMEMMDYDMVVEVNKSRTTGDTDLLVGLYYEAESRRLKSSRAENIIYGWEERPVQSEIEDMPDFESGHYYDKF